MSCNGCRVLRKGCGENCILRASLQWIENPQAQAYATVFVAKFFGRAGLMSFLASVPEKQRPALFQSLLFEACGRTVNPVNGAVGLLWTGNWHLCQAAVQAVLGGGTLQRIPVLLTGGSLDITKAFQVETIHDTSNHQGDNLHPKQSLANEGATNCLANLGLSPTSCSTSKILPSSHSPQQCGTQSMNSEESETTTCFENFGFDDPCAQGEKEELKTLNLFT